MVPQQAISKCIGYRFDVLGVELQEVRIIPLFSKDIFPVIASVVDVVIPAGLKMWQLEHCPS